MKFGFYLPTFGALAKRDPLLEIAHYAEELAYDSMVVSDHVVAPINPKSQYPYSVGPDVPWGSTGEHLELITELAFLSAATEKIKLVSSVMIIPHRNPVLTAKMLSTVDVLSNGRLIVGVGVGWLEEEFLALDTRPFRERGKVSDEYLSIFKTLWTEETPSYAGEYYQFAPLQFAPKPIQKPGPPIWVGGQSKAAIRRAVNFGDAWHPVGANPASPLEPETLKKDLEYMKTYSDSVGRDYSEMTVAMKAPVYDKEFETGGERRRFSGTPGQIMSDVEEYANLGVSHLILDTRSSHLSQFMDKMNWLMEQVISPLR
jgi:probable F420-dependent oxidoreductase